MKQFLRIAAFSQCIIVAATFTPSLASHQSNRLETLNHLRASAETNDDAQSQFNQLKISFVTGNEMKAREMSMILAEHGATKGPNPETSLVDLRVVNVDLPEIQEVSTEAIAKNKAIQAAQLANGPCVVEDTSLEFVALGGMPGPYIKWFQQELQSEGLYNLLLAYEDKSAVAVCTLAFCPFPHADPVLFTGRTRGTIVEPVEGRGFGWDSIFVPDGFDRPFSSMSTLEKNELSHRGQAVRQWANWLGENQQELWERQNGKSAVGHKGLNFKGTYAEE
jgi:inosine triphosphate pyrophosphatase|eukprot:scaffold2972_cov257-Chaetoceros_neogracile.AAC.2